MSFDLRTHIRDPKSGKVIHKQPYRMTVVSRGPGDSIRVFERDGKKFYENGEPVVEEKAVEEPIKVEAAPAVVAAAKAAQAAPAQAAAQPAVRR